jgi:hypothetical protein
VAFSPDGHWLAAGWNDEITLWDARPLTPSVQIECEAFGLVKFLFARYSSKVGTVEIPNKDEVIESINNHNSIGEPVRQKALSLANEYRIDPALLNAGSWAVVSKPNGTDATYRQALRWAETASKLEPQNGSYLNTLGVAEYRMSKYRDALDTLIRSELIDAGTPKGGEPSNLAFQAMAQYQLGRRDQARAVLGRLRETMKKRNRILEEDAAFLREAEVLLAGGEMELPADVFAP